MEFVGTQLLALHTFLSIFLFFPPLWNLFALFFHTSHTKKLHALALSAPAYYTILAACLFSGIVIWAMLGFVLLINILIMLIFWFISFGLEIRRHSYQKRTLRESDTKKRAAFFRFAIFKYSLDISFFVLLFLLWVV